MSARILDGADLAARLRADIGEQVAVLVAEGHRAPGLAVVLVGDNPASHVYVRNKGVATRKAGMVSTEHRLPDDVSEADLLGLVARLNADEAVDGILVQLPLPAQIRPEEVLAAIDPEKGRGRLSRPQCRPAVGRRGGAGPLHAPGLHEADRGGRA